MAWPVCGRAVPGVKGCHVPPPRFHEPGGALVGRLEELEALEALLVVDRARPGGEPAGKFVPAIGWHCNRIDLHNSHVLDDARLCRGTGLPVRAGSKLARTRPRASTPRPGLSRSGACASVPDPGPARESPPRG